MKKKREDFYPTLAEAAAATQKLGIQNREEYRRRYSEDPRLPFCPDRVYKDEGFKWFDFLGKEGFYPTLAEAAAATQKLGIQNREEYHHRHSEDSRLPSCPNKIYKAEGFRFCELLGTEAPLIPENIPEYYSGWRDRIEEFLTFAMNSMSKKTHLSRFVRQYVEEEELPSTPESFLLSKPDAKPYNDFLEFQPARQRSKIHYAVMEFLDWIIRDYLTIEDKQIGELVRKEDVRNPFRRIQVEKINECKPSQTVRSLMPYSYLDKIANWIIPSGAKNLKDLDHLYESFDCDWYEIYPALLEKDSPNCVWKTVETKKQRVKTLIWSPANWLLLYALIKTGLRGGMLNYSDSGEGDKELPVLDLQGKIFWKANNLPTAGAIDRQCIISRCQDDQCGIFTPLNKVGHGQGFFCPWMDESLAYWLIRLREFQSAYNPIKTPTPWVSLTSLKTQNLEQKKARGCNCFLFRAFGKEQPGTFSTRLSQSIAAALYHIQDKDMPLATVTSGKERLISHYQSNKYVPHSIRGSFITGLIMEGGLSPFVVMKIVGHTCLVTNCYYAKLSNAAIRQKIGDAQKKALQQQALDKQLLIEQGRLDEVKNELISDSETLEALSESSIHPASYVFSDFGFCPYAGVRCHEGGELFEGTQRHAPVPEGYLGKSNCLRCRFHCTSPAWMGGLLSISNEIMLACNQQSGHYQQLQADLEVLNKKKEALSIEEYDAEKAGRPFDHQQKRQVAAQVNQITAETEKAGLKLVSLVEDIQAASKLLKQCHALINEQPAPDDNDDTRLQLIVPADMELRLEVEECSEFYQLSEVCRNAEIYQSAKDSLAVYRRSQLVDQMLEFNRIMPELYKLDSLQQRKVGNQFVRLLESRLQSWDKVDALMDGRIILKDLTDEEKISRVELKNIIRPEPLKIVETDNDRSNEPCSGDDTGRDTGAIEENDHQQPDNADTGDNL